MEGRDIAAFVRQGPAANTALVFGGFHGDEPKSVSLTRLLIRHLATAADDHREVRWVVVPVANPDGYEKRNRRNARRVDLNRNFPTKNWLRTRMHSRMFGGIAPGSEPETQAVIDVVRRYRPARIITIHSIDGGRHCNNYDGPAGELARAMARFNGYPVCGSIGYPTPGSFGTWAGVERNIPTITLELPSLHSTKRCWEENRAALLLAV